MFAPLFVPFAVIFHTHTRLSASVRGAVWLVMRMTRLVIQCSCVAVYIEGTRKMCEQCKRNGQSDRQKKTKASDERNRWQQFLVATSINCALRGPNMVSSLRRHLRFAINAVSTHWQLEDFSHGRADPGHVEEGGPKFVHDAKLLQRIAGAVQLVHSAIKMAGNLLLFLWVL